MMGETAIVNVACLFEQRRCNKEDYTRPNVS